MTQSSYRMNSEQKCAFTSVEVHEILGGYWYTDDAHPELQDPHFIVDYLVIGVKSGNLPFPNTCLIAMTNETWLKGNGSTGHFRNTANTSLIDIRENYAKPKIKSNLVGVISECPIPEICGIFPQLIVDNPYGSIRILADAARKKMDDNGTVIAVTGAVGKSTTVRMLHCLLHDEADYISNINGHNSRTGVPMWLASVGRFDPKFRQPSDKPNVCTLEIAAAALWMGGGGICKIVVRPHIGIITHMALTQYQEGSRSIRDVAIAKSKVCHGIVPDGKAILYRDMPEFDLVKEQVIGYGALPVTYGETPDCDTYVKKYEFTLPTAGEEVGILSANIEAVVLNEEISYTIGTIGKPVVLNSLAALTAAKLAGFDIHKIAGKFADFKGNANVLQIVNHCGICIVNNSHNLEMPSIMSAFDLLKQIKQKPGSRKVVLLSRVDNWAEMAPELHLQLTEPISDSGFDKFFFHEPGDEFKLLINTIPQKLSGGRYVTLEEAVYAAVDYIREGDAVLVIGSHFTSDFGHVMDLLIKRIDHKTANPPQLPTCAAWSLDKGGMLVQNNIDLTVEEGLGGVLLLYLALTSLYSRKVRLAESVEVSELAAAEKNQPRALGLSKNAKAPFGTLLAAMIASNAPDATLALAHHLGRAFDRSILRQYEDLAAKIALDTRAIRNVTGRRNSTKPQSFTVEDLYKTARLIFARPADALKPLRTTFAAHNGVALETNSDLHSLSGIMYYYCFGDQAHHAIAYAKVKDENMCLCVCGAGTANDRDYAIADMLFKLKKRDGVTAN